MCRDKKLTLTQNYRRLGLTSRLNAPAGGVEKVQGSSADDPELEDAEDPFHAKVRGHSEKQKKPAEARVERDPETGKILRVIREENEGDGTMDIAGRKRRKANPLEDPMEELPDSNISVMNGAQPSFGVVTQLEREAAMQEEALKKRKPRQQSNREIEWLQRLAEKYGDDTRAMVRDRKLNPMQQTEGDIARRLRKWRDGKS